MNDLRQQLMDHISETGISQSAISRSIGYSPSTISQYLDNIYKGDVKAVEKEIEQYLSLEQERKAQPLLKVPFVDISAAKIIYDNARTAHREGEITVITGEPGLGKTFGLEYYRGKYPKKVALITAYKGYTARTLISKLHKEFFGGDGSGSKTDLIEDLCSIGGTNRCIIIDQAEYLNLTALETIRYIYDVTECGLVLAGTHRLLENLRGKNKCLQQLWSRVGRAVRLDRLTAADTEKIIQTVLPNSNGLWKSYHEHCNGNARVLSKIIRRTKRVAERNNTAVTESIVVRVAREHKESLGIA